MLQLLLLIQGRVVMWVWGKAWGGLGVEARAWAGGAYEPWFIVCGAEAGEADPTARGLHVQPWQLALFLGKTSPFDFPSPRK